MIAIIPARGGSKGLPGKNIIDFCGKPLIAHTIEAALSSKYITSVVVSTDCRDIADVAVKYGADVPFMRPSHLATDSARAIDVYRYTCDELARIREVDITEFVVLLPTCPLRYSDDIDGAIELFATKKADSVISYTQELHPLRWHKYVGDDFKFESIFPDTLANRQEERVSYYPNGAIYVMKRNILENNSYYSENSYAYLMKNENSVDIDTIKDLEYAKFLMERRWKA